MALSSFANLVAGIGAVSSACRTTRADPNSRPIGIRGLRSFPRGESGRRTAAIGRFAGAACALLLLACGAPEGAPRSDPPLQGPLRVVSLLPAASAWLVDLGASPALIAVDPESARLPGLGALPIASLADVPGLRPDLVLVPPPRADDAPALERLRAEDIEVIEIAPGNFDDVFALCRGLGARLAGPVRAARFENALGRELGALAAASHGRRRPRVAAVLGVEPLEMAPAHSFATDLIELAGGTSTTHDHQQPRPPTTVAELAATAPDLVLVLSPTPLAEPAQAAARRVLRGVAPIAVFVLDTQRFWVRDGSDAVRRLRALVEPLSRGRAPGSPTPEGSSRPG